MAPQRKRLNIIFAAAECAPFAKVGGLGDVVGSLPQALTKNGCTISVFLPFYRNLNRAGLRIKKKMSVSVFFDHRAHTVQVFSGKRGKNPITYYFLDHPLLASPDVYSTTHGTSHEDVMKFTLFSRAVVETVQQAKIPCDIIHCHDWHTALIPSVVDELAVTKGYPYYKTALTIHNLGNQGIADREFVKLAAEHWAAIPALLEDYEDLDEKKLNILKIGILSANVVTTVSPTYAREILTPTYGAGLETFLTRRKKNVVGILNGIDTTLFDPARDRTLIKRYSRRSVIVGKGRNKEMLQRRVRLPASHVPLFGAVSRLVTQKGFDLLVEAVENLAVREHFQLIILGTGEQAIERSLASLSEKHRDRIATVTRFDLSLAQQIYAGSDFFLMPSRFEPCGLGQLIAMRYGTVPVVRETGGLKDTVKNGRTGITFKEASAEALTRAMNRAVTLYRRPQSWYTMVKRCMSENFSWNASAKRYASLYRNIL